MIHEFDNYSNEKRAQMILAMTLKAIVDSMDKHLIELLYLIHNNGALNKKQFDLLFKIVITSPLIEAEFAVVYLGLKEIQEKNLKSQINETILDLEAAEDVEGVEALLWFIRYIFFHLDIDMSSILPSGVEPKLGIVAIDLGEFGDSLKSNSGFMNLNPLELLEFQNLKIEAKKDPSKTKDVVDFINKHIKQ